MLGLLCVSIRWWYQNQLSSDPLQGGALLDTQAYDQDAWDWVQHGFQAPGSYYRPPGYGWLLGILRQLGFSPAGVLHFQAVLDGLSLFVLAGLAAAFWSSAAAGLLAAAIFALAPPLIYFAGERLETSWVNFWLCLHLACIYLALQRQNRRWSFLSGLSLAFTSLIRANALLWAPLAAWWLWKQRRGHAGLFALGLILLITPVTLRNYLQSDEWILISANGGVNLFVGNVRDAELHGPVPYYKHLPGPVAGWAWQTLGKRAFDAGATTAGQQSRWHARQAFEAMLARFDQTIALFLKKGVALFNNYELSNNRDLYRTHSPLQGLAARLWSWAWLWPLALLAIFTCWQEYKTVRAFAACTLCLSLSVVLFFVCSRHRAPLIPILAVLAAGGALSLWRSRSLWRKKLIPLAVLLLSAIALQTDWFGHRSLYAQYRIDPLGEGNLYMQNGAFQEAAQSFEFAIERYPQDHLARTNLGILHWELKEFPQAESLLRSAVDLNPEDARAHCWLAAALVDQEKAAEAFAHANQALELRQNYGQAWLQKSKALLLLHRLSEARNALQQTMRFLPPGPATQWAQRTLGKLAQRTDGQ